MAKKPPVCISLPPPGPIPVYVQNFRIRWTSVPPPDPAIAIDETHALPRTPPESNFYVWENLSAAPGQLYRVVLKAPFDPDFNGIGVEALDALGNSHYAEAYFPPAEPPPITTTIDWWPIKTHPTDIIIVDLYP